MKKKIRRIALMLRLDLQNMRLNKQLVIVFLIPLVFGGLMHQLYKDVEEAERVYGYYSFYLAVLMTTSLMGAIFLPTTLAEEKERSTLRTLRMSGIRITEFLLAKGIGAMLLTEISVTFTLLITGVPIRLLPTLWLLVVPVTTIFSFIGIIISMYAAGQMEVGVFSAPVVLIFLVPPVLSAMSSLMSAIALTSPLNAMMHLFWYMTGTDVVDMHSKQPIIIQPGIHVCVLCIWLVVTGMMCLFLYRKKGL